MSTEDPLHKVKEQAVRHLDALIRPNDCLIPEPVGKKASAHYRVPGTEVYVKCKLVVTHMKSDGTPYVRLRWYWGTSKSLKKGKTSVWAWLGTGHARLVERIAKAQAEVRP